MPNNPVQIVLNSKDYLTVPEKQAVGSHKDFFAGQDKEFVNHKLRLQRQLAAVGTNFRQSGARSGVVRVTLRKEAWAKSHRPMQVLFPENRRQCVGAGNIGELFYFLASEDLAEIGTEISKAEDSTRWKENERTGKTRAVPSARRSEVGAIENISIPALSEKRNFSAEQGAAWLADPRTGGMYLVEIFAPAGPILEGYVASVQAKLSRAAGDAHLKVETIPIQLRVGKRPRYGRLIGVRFFPSTAPAAVPDHQKLLTTLESQTYVRRVLLPPLVAAAASTPVLSQPASQVALPERKAGRTYPKVGVVDGGISSFYTPWIIGSHRPLAAEHQDTGHADFIAGLLVVGQALNGDEICREDDGCELYDIALLPGQHVQHVFPQYYPKAIVDFMQELASAVAVASHEHGVRVFNMSLNLESPVAPDTYGPVAELLDEIADENNVMFVVSAGNLPQPEWRRDWPASPAAALKRLAERSTPDTLFQPAESARCLSVGAINPPNHPPHVHGVPTCYTRRGPGMRVGMKPDFAHYGGARPNGNKETGLQSANSAGAVVHNLGTSFATPLVAKTAASLDSKVLGSLSRDTVAALLVQLASVPEALRHESLQEVTRQFIGFGVPATAMDMLETADHEITLVFSDVMVIGHALQFDFAWPHALVDPTSSACRGRVRLTLAYRPKLDARFGSEFVRVNLDAHLRQEAGISWRGRLTQQLLPDGEANSEAELIRHGLKWWPLKVYGAEFPKGVGRSSNWRLSVESIVRAGEAFPVEGVPFTVALTISDREKQEPVFATMRAYLRSQNVKIHDIRTAIRIRART